MTQTEGWASLSSSEVLNPAAGSRAIRFLSLAPRRVPTPLWLLGAALVAGGLALDSQRRRRLARKASALEDDRWLRDAAALATQVGTRVPRLLITHQIDVPMTWGTRRPVIVLPPAALEWSTEHRRYVLLHELAHVGRADALLFGLGRLACAIAWFNPLVWWVASRQRAESELACDDRVVAAGASPSTYAGELVALARQLRPEPFSAAAALALPTKLSQRIRAILDQDRNRTALHRGRILGLVAAAGVLALPAVAGIHLTHRSGGSALEAQAALRWLPTGQSKGAGVEAPGTPPAEATTPPTFRRSSAQSAPEAPGPAPSSPR